MIEVEKSTHILITEFIWDVKGTGQPGPVLLEPMLKLTWFNLSLVWPFNLDQPVDLTTFLTQCYSNSWWVCYFDKVLAETVILLHSLMDKLIFLWNEVPTRWLPRYCSTPTLASFTSLNQPLSFPYWDHCLSCSSYRASHKRILILICSRCWHLESGLYYYWDDEWETSMEWVWRGKKQLMV